MAYGAGRIFYQRIGKRLFDIVILLLLLPIATPLILIIGGLILLNDGRPVIYRGLRTGRRDSRFYILKFRTMVRNADSIGGPTTGLNDPRITTLGGVLRRYKLDELPQVINVLKGEMSFVGPRPEVPQYTDQLIGEQRRILEIPPGITDFSSIKFHALDHIVGSQNVDATFENKVLPRKNRLRLLYADRVSFCTDLFIILKTAKTVILRNRKS